MCFFSLGWWQGRFAGSAICSIGEGSIAGAEQFQCAGSRQHGMGVCDTGPVGQEAELGKLKNNLGKAKQMRGKLTVRQTQEKLRIYILGKLRKA